jgi:hypothetical protein
MEIAIAEETSNHPGQSDFLLLEKQLGRLCCPGGTCRFAERSIDVQYYLYHDDLVGRLFKLSVALRTLPYCPKWAPIALTKIWQANNNR